MPAEKKPGLLEPERPFGRDEGGDDVRRVVWTGHTVQTPEGRGYFGAVGLTQNGYYRAAEVQRYGADEVWRWQAERHTDRQDAISSAETASANRVNPESTPATTDEAFTYGGEWKEPDSATARLSDMAIPDHVKAKADAEIAGTGVQKMPVRDMDAAQAVDNYGDRGKELDSMREQKRQDMAQEKTPAPNQPDKG